MAQKIKIIFFGTGSSIPTIKRNHPSFFLSWGNEKILIDCGEGTQKQFRIAKENPCKITKILITHWHADHVLGLAGLIKTMELNGRKKELMIFGPSGIKEKIKLLLDLFGFKKNYDLKVFEAKGKFFETEDFFLASEKMKHSVPCNAYSFVIKNKIKINKNKIKKLGIKSGPNLKNLKQGKDIFFKEKKYLLKDLTDIEKGKKISFVLDTIFNKNIIPFVFNSDILVCESTFSSILDKKAKEFNHLTSKKAAEIARDSKSKKLILTHISQRYEKNSKLLLKEARRIFKKTYLKKDLDKIFI